MKYLIPGKSQILKNEVIMIQGYLSKNVNGRYAVHYELTSGDCVEVLVDGVWQQTRVESSKGQYYLTNGHPIDGAMIRIKSNSE